MNDYLQYVGLIGFIVLCACQIKLWFLMHNTTCMVWDWVRTSIKKSRP